ncbi:hypothetical protein CCY99_01010 [Helicobacter sp. 16-1353]|uniref:type IIG restriction enzyme/methyltransferase n=1 Tax=Helicobacter sp. 16-1353 TaxID=2004996 RepID=UPI000DCAE8F3|nr:TaqI-like C-terminal specificity domain-containing protein [Helicobacter sp. 16-1353]RAX55311.1 hypothetical protein CCY99_01010 [Helicobacter sp. 16-1353]
MHFIPINLSEFLEPYNIITPSKRTLERFQNAFSEFLEKSILQDSEEYQKNEILKFLGDFYGYELNTKDRIDLAIYEDSYDLHPAVIFEIKSLSNKAEFPSQNKDFEPDSAQTLKLDFKDFKTDSSTDSALDLKTDSAPNSLESKAFYESILYYLRESKAKNNNNIKHIILATAREFYIIDSKQYEENFAKDKQILKFYKNCDLKDGSDTSTKKFYSSLENYLKTADLEIDYCYINLDSIAKSIAKDSKDSTKSAHDSAKQITQDSKTDSTGDSTAQANLSLLYQALSPFCLLKRKSQLDANTLNQGFYNELLYILGLKEISVNGIIKIVLSDTSNALSDSISRIFKLDRKADFEVIFALLTTWNNRILFLRLLESMLLSFKHIDKSFLDLESIPNFATLNTLFFEILAKKEADRADLNLPKILRQIPYLNSSLFEKTALELEGREIKLLDSNALAIYPSSILYKTPLAKTLLKSSKAPKLPLLEYLFAFLNAYDFTTTPKDIENHTKINFDKLINSAILGLVFEKLNGYKDGSFYTPSFITNYMCEESIRKIALEKFRENGFKIADISQDLANLDSVHSQNAPDSKNPADSQTPQDSADSANSQSTQTTQKQALQNLYNQITDIKKANDIIDSIRICDPAVGSGHFLVSALNQLILLKFELGILCDENGKKLKDIRLELKNDEIVIYDSNNEIHHYTHPAHENIESHKIQKALFYQKRKLIESCLFGVDINPNSCEITKLRLWIELLKYSFYTDIAQKHLETLPNIDINIKCGNSLISNFSLDSSLTGNVGIRLGFARNLQEAIREYKAQVDLYKNALGNKRTITQNINNLKEIFKNYLLENSPIKSNLTQNLKSFVETYGDLCFDLETPFGMEMIKIARKNNYKFQPTLYKLEPESIDIKGQNLLDSIFRDYDALENIKNADTFEWRFEFPEVLDKNGDFKGFDLIIGNPPYIDYRQISFETIKGTKNYAVNVESKRPNIFCYFVEKGIEVTTHNATISFINPIAMLQADFAYGTRKLLLDKGHIDFIADCSYIKVFDSASTYPMVWALKKSKKQDSIRINLWQQDRFAYSHNIKSYENNDKLSINIQKNQINFLKVKCDTLADLGTLKWGTSKSGYGKMKIKSIDFESLDKKSKKLYAPIIQTADIKRYAIVWQKEYIPIEIYSNEIKKCFNKEKIVIARMTKNIQATFDTNKFFVGKSTLIVDFAVNPKYILGILNSKLADFWYKHYFGSTHLAGGYVRYDIPYLERIPIPQITESNKKLADKIIDLVDKILEAKAQDSGESTKELESKIDFLVCSLYGLDKQETDFVIN